jgi:vacuolar iron transporter family protein
LTGQPDSWLHEKESAWLYRQVAAVEPDPHKSRLFLQLAAAAEVQAERWAAANPQARPCEFHPAIRARIVAACWRR